MEKRYLNIEGAEFKTLGVENNMGKITGYGSVFNVRDSYGDVVQSGAFMQSISKKRPKMLYQHDPREVIGVWTKCKEDEKGLLLEGEINLEVTKGKDVYNLLKQGALDGLSIGFRTLDEEFDANGVRKLKTIELLEVSVVTFPANKDSLVTGVKNAPKTEREFEGFLREMGYGREQAKAIVAKGFKGFIDMQRDVEGDKVSTQGEVQRDADEVKALLENILTTLKGTLSDDRRYQEIGRGR